jgi:hypothetical protein
MNRPVNRTLNRTLNRPVHLLAALFAALLAAAATLLVPSAVAPAGADPIGNCTTTVGAVVAVDFSHWGGPTVRGCGVNPPSGYALLHAAGFSTAGDSHDGPAFICRLGNQAFDAGRQYPTPDHDACVLTPPASAYWSYWVAPAGQSTWSYSSGGAMSHAPKPGEVDLWVFGGTDIGGTTGSGVPRFGPDSVRAHNVAPTGGSNVGSVPTTRANAAPTMPNPSTPMSTLSSTPSSTPVVVSGTTVPTPMSTRPTGAKPAKIGATRSSTTTERKGSTSDAAPADSSSPQFVDALPAVHTHTSSGSIVPLLVAGALVIALAGGAAGALRRRRQTE